jgi:hypothetical protein
MTQLQILATSPFNPVLLNSEILEVSTEQLALIREVLEIACSDVQFADKAYNAVVAILTKGSVAKPEITSLSPDTAVVGAPAFTLHVTGTGFEDGSVIALGGTVEPTTVVSETELTTEVDMSTAVAAIDIPVQVQNLSGVVSNTMIFSLTGVVGATESAEKELVPSGAESESKGPAVSSWNPDKPDFKF